MTHGSGAVHIKPDLRRYQRKGRRLALRADHLHHLDPSGKKSYKLGTLASAGTAALCDSGAMAHAGMLMKPHLH
jgi:hypothetical protein